MENEVQLKIYKEGFGKKFSENSMMNSDDCAGYIKTVAREMGIILPDTDTEGLITRMENKWEVYEDKFAALKAVEKGSLVVVAIRAVELKEKAGHIAIVLQEKDRQNFHYLFGGSSNPVMRSNGDKTIAYVFQKKFHYLLRYYSPK